MNSSRTNTNRLFRLLRGVALLEGIFAFAIIGALIYFSTQGLSALTGSDKQLQYIVQKKEIKDALNSYFYSDDVFTTINALPAGHIDGMVGATGSSSSTFLSCA